MNCAEQALGHRLLGGPPGDRWWDKHQLVVDVRGNYSGMVFARHTPDINVWVQTLQRVMREVGHPLNLNLNLNIYLNLKLKLKLATGPPPNGP